MAPELAAIPQVGDQLRAIAIDRSSPSRRAPLVLHYEGDGQRRLAVPLGEGLVRLESVVLAGDTATAIATFHQSFVELGEPLVLTLRRFGGRWRVTDEVPQRYVEE